MQHQTCLALRHQISSAQSDPCVRPSEKEAKFQPSFKFVFAMGCPDKFTTVVVEELNMREKGATCGRQSSNARQALAQTKGARTRSDPCMTPLAGAFHATTHTGGVRMWLVRLHSVDSASRCRRRTRSRHTRQHNLLFAASADLSKQFSKHEAWKLLS